MKIKLAIVEKDSNYLNRITSVFGSKYADKLEIYSFNDLNMAFAAFETKKPDVLIVSSSFEIDLSYLPRRCGFAYFVDSADVDTFSGQKAICKFQRADLIYKQILSIYSEMSGSLTGLKMADEASRVIIFSSPSGGVGTSSFAAAAALRYSHRGEKTLYLNLEKFGSSDVFFSGDGQFGMSDVIFAVKSKNINVAMKLESCVKADKSGVYFYSQPQYALDMLEMDLEDTSRLIDEIKLTGSYKNLIIDMPFSLDYSSLEIYRQAGAVVIIGDGSETSNIKTFRAYSSLVMLDENSDVRISDKALLLYNKFSNKTSRAIEGIGIKNLGGAPRYEHTSEKQVLEQLSSLGVLDDITK